MQSLAGIKPIVWLLLGFIIGAGVTYALTASPLATMWGRKKEIKEIPIGAALALTGDLGAFGAKHRNAFEMAVEDVNEYLRKIGAPFKIVAYVEDTKTSKEGALAAVQALAAKGIKVIVGPLASSEVATVKSFVDSNKIVIISHSSTALSLAIPDDYIFRLVPTDYFQSKALARLLWSKGIRKAAVIYRGDDWGEGLYLGFKENFEKLGGKVSGIKYDPKAKEYSAEVRRLSDIVKEFGGGADTGVLLISFEEDGISILMLAKEDPVLSKVLWFGTDGTAYSTKIASQVGEIASQLGGLLSTCYMPAGSPKRDEFMRRYRERFGENPDPYCMNIYDAVWVAALAILESGKYDGEVIAKVLPEVASRYFGVSGWTALDENGDRAFGDYIIVGIFSADGGFKWREVGFYLSSSDTIQWLTSEGG